MTNKTPPNKAEASVKTPTTFANTTDMANDDGLKSKALPQAGALKERFKAGSIPLQTDFADLIDLANMGRQVVGGAADQTGLANGFTLSSKGRLELKPNTAKGITVDQDGMGIKVGKGINVDQGGVYLPLGWGLRHGGEGLDVSCKKDGGLGASKNGTWVISGPGITVDSSGVGVKAGNGIAVNSRGVNIKLAKGRYANGDGQGKDGTTEGSAGGLDLTVNGLSVDAGDGMQINAQGVSIRLAVNSGLSANSTDGVKVMAGSGIKISNGAVTIDQENVLPRGIITMFSGSQAPDGWAFCNGDNGTPDLRDRFIKGSSAISSGMVTGGSKNIVYTPTGRVTVNPHALTIEEMPKHNHKITGNYGTNDGYWLPAMQLGLLNRPGTHSKSISDAGNNKAHTHTASFNGNSSTINIEPQYYTLAFIMKL